MDGEMTDEELDIAFDAEKKRIFKKIDNAAKSLNKALEDAKKIWPDAQYYLEDTANFLLMSGSSHDESNGEKARQDRILHHTYIYDASGGGW